jgi:DNA-binding NtrC family response regulator/predicted hydrocarbon binding protein
MSSEMPSHVDVASLMSAAQGRAVKVAEGGGRRKPALSAEGVEELLELDTEGGVIRFAGQRAVLLDTVAMGLLRAYLVEHLGHTAARTVLTQFGFAQGWRMAEALEHEFSWASEEERCRAGSRMLSLEGLFRVADDGGLLTTTGIHITNSYEAEHHLLEQGRADEPVCWTIGGLASGYISRCLGKEIYVLEDACTAAGDACCHFTGRTREEWGEERAHELVFFKPTQLQEALDVSLARVVASLKDSERKLREHRRALVRVVRDFDLPSGLVTQSAKMKTLVDLARRVAKVDSTVLITGESGVGKERVARLVHEESTRAAGPFIALNCGAITETLLESELFGHARGAFTGAKQDRPGLFESANGGTLLLDEIGEVSPAMQVKLLRALQEREVRRVGENKTRKVDVRILAATNRDLRQQVTAGNFREDLFYRLKVVELHVPALRERREDILPLARALLVEAGLRMKRSITGLTPAAADQLMRHAWPGNVRELENAMERAVALARGSRVEVEDLPEEIRQAFPVPVPTSGLVRSLEEIEKDYLLAALELNHGNQTLTAMQLKIGSATMYRKLKRYGALLPRGRRHLAPRGAEPEPPQAGDDEDGRDAL